MGSPPNARHYQTRQCAEVRWQDGIMQLDYRHCQTTITLRWSPLNVRRRNIKLKVLYNIWTILASLKKHLHITLVHPPVIHTTKHFFNLLFPSSLKYRHSFFIDVIPVWNSLSSFIVNSSSLIKNMFMFLSLITVYTHYLCILFCFFNV